MWTVWSAATECSRKEGQIAWGTRGDTSMIQYESVLSAKENNPNAGIIVKPTRLLIKKTL